MNATNYCVLRHNLATYVANNLYNQYLTTQFYTPVSLRSL